MSDLKRYALVKVMSHTDRNLDMPFFTFDAFNEQDANDLVRNWTLSHGMAASDAYPRLATGYELGWTPNNEYVRP